VVLGTVTIDPSVYSARISTWSNTGISRNDASASHLGHLSFLAIRLALMFIGYENAEMKTVIA
jgi:hypothetical protein